MNEIVAGFSLIASLVFGTLTVIFIFNGLRQLYKRGGGAGGIIFVTALSLLTSALILWQVVDMLGQVAPH